MRPILYALMASVLGVLAVGASPVEAREATCDIDTILELLISQLLLGDAQGFCSSYIASSVTTTKTSTGTVGNTAVITKPATAVITTTAVGGAAPTVTQTVYSNCAITGYVKDTAAYHFDGSGAYGTFETCSAQCQADAACVSFAYGSGQCLLFSAGVLTNVNPSSSSPFVFYDRRCPNSTAQAPSEKRDAVVSGQAGQAEVAPSITIKNPVFVSSACHCLVKNPPTSTATATTTRWITVIRTIQTTVTVATRVETVFTNPNTSPVTVTITTTA